MIYSFAWFYLPFLMAIHFGKFFQNPEFKRMFLLDN